MARHAAAAASAAGDCLASRESRSVGVWWPLALPMVHGGPFWGVLTAPFSHSDWSHLLSNSLWFLPLSYLVLLNGLRAYIAVWIAVCHGGLGVVVAAGGKPWSLRRGLWPLGLSAADRLATETADQRVVVVGMPARRRLAPGVAALPQSARCELDWPHLRLCRRLDRSMGRAQVAITA